MEGSVLYRNIKSYQIIQIHSVFHNVQFAKRVDINLPMIEILNIFIDRIVYAYELLIRNSRARARYIISFMRSLFSLEGRQLSR